MEVFCENLNAYETSLQFGLPQQTAWMRNCRGKAVKLLDIHKHRPPKTEQYRFIHMTRNSWDQAKSQQMFLTLTTGIKFDNHSLRKLQRSIKRDREAVRQLLPCYKNSTSLEIKFSELITYPHTVADQVAQFCEAPLEVEAMAAIVIPRTPEPIGGHLEALQIRGIEGLKYGNC